MPNVCSKTDEGVAVCSFEYIIALDFLSYFPPLCASSTDLNYFSSMTSGTGHLTSRLPPCALALTLYLLSTPLLRSSLGLHFLSKPSLGRRLCDDSEVTPIVATNLTVCSNIASDATAPPARSRILRPRRIFRPRRIKQ